MNQTTKDAIAEHAIRDFPREACGLVVRAVDGDEYVPCRNLAITASEHFVLSPEDYADAEDAGEVLCIVHSHPNVPARPSQGDLVACERSGLPWLIVAVWKEPEDAMPRIVGNYYWTPDGYIAPLVGREFSFGVLDCYTLIQDWYRLERGLILPTFARRDNFWKKGHEVDLYAQYAQTGFYDIGDAPMQVGDIPLMQIRSTIANHAGVYIEGDLLLHHMYGRLSTRDPYSRSYYHEATRRVVRYRG